MKPRGRRELDFGVATMRLGILRLEGQEPDAAVTVGRRCRSSAVEEALQGISHFEAIAGIAFPHNQHPKARGAKLSDLGAVSRRVPL